jgi:putative transposase
LLIDQHHKLISITRQAELLGISRASVYYRPVVNLQDLELMRLIDEQYTQTPFYGSRRMSVALKRNGHEAGRKKARTLMAIMGIEAIYPKPNLSKPFLGHKIYPYLLRGLPITGNNQVWGTDITYIRLNSGWLYLVAIMDWFSRYVLSWELSTSLEQEFCLRALETALGRGRPKIFNSDQGSQFTSLDFTSRLEKESILVSMDGRGRAMDNIFTERLWRTIKYEEVYIKDYQNISETRLSLGNYLAFYNQERPHQALGYRTPKEVYALG